MVARGAKKVVALDISSEMIENARKDLTEKGIIDKFELVCADILDDTFQLQEPVDCIVCSYTITTFINTHDMLTKILAQCKKNIKPDGMVFITDFSYVEQPCNNFVHEMYTATVVPDQKPKLFEPFHFFTDMAPEHPYEIFHIPANVMFQAAIEVGFKQATWQLQYASPEYEKHPMCVAYKQDCNGPDYLMRLKPNEN